MQTQTLAAASGMSPTSTPTVTPQPCPPGYTLTSRGCIRAGIFQQTVTATATQQPHPSLCPAPWMISTSIGCLYPAGTITAFDARRNKWRIAVTFEALRPLPLPTPSQPRPMSTLTPAASTSSSFMPTAVSVRSGQQTSTGFGQAATHQAVAETDTPPTNVKVVDIATFTIAVGEPTSGQSTPPSPLPLPPSSPPASPAPASTSTSTPGRVDVGPTTVPTSTSPPFVPPSSGSFFPGPLTTRPRFTGCIARFNKSRRVYAIYCPIGATSTAPSLGIASDDFRCLYGSCNGLGQAAVTPPVPAGFVKTAETTTLPGAGETAAGEERDNFFRANNPAMWITLVGTVAVVGGGGYWLMRRRRRAA